MNKLYRKTSLIAQLVFATGIFIVLLYMLMMYTNMAVQTVNELHASIEEASEETIASFLMGGVGIFEIMASYIMNIWLLVLTMLLFMFACIGYGCYSPEHFSFMVVLEVMYCIFASITCVILMYLGKVGMIWAIVGVLSIIYTIINVIFVGKDLHNEKKNAVNETVKTKNDVKDDAEESVEKTEDADASDKSDKENNKKSKIAYRK